MSAEDIKKRKLNYLFCNQGDLHDGEQLNYVFIDSKVASSVLMCPVCKTQQGDKKQRIIPLKIFLAETSQHLQQNQGSYQQESLTSQIDSIHQKMLSGLKDTVQKMAISIKELEDAINQGHKLIKQKLADQSQTQQNLPQLFEQILNSNYETVNKLKHDVFRITENVQFTNGKIEIDFKPQKVLDCYNKALTEFNSAINSLNSSFKTNLGKVTKTLEKLSQLKISSPVLSEYQFSQTLKSPTINITGKQANQNTNQNHEQRFALIEPSLDLTQKSKFAIRVLQLTNWVGLGICFQKVLTSKQFKFDYNNLGHGSYLISSNGYSWSHSKKQDNIQNQSFNFVTNDIIICEFDPEKKVVEFRRRGKDPKKFKLEVEIPENDEVYACVNLCNQNDKVEIVHEFEDEETS